MVWAVVGRLLCLNDWDPGSAATECEISDTGYSELTTTTIATAATTTGNNSNRDNKINSEKGN